MQRLLQTATLMGALEQETPADVHVTKTLERAHFAMMDAHEARLTEPEALERP